MKETESPPAESRGEDDEAAAASPAADASEADGGSPTEADIMEAVRAFMEEAGFKDDPRAKVILQAVRTSTFHQGPIPPAETLRAYDAVVPGLAQQIVAAWNEQRAHRLALEKDLTRGIEARMNRGQWLSFAVALAGLALAAVVGIWGSAFAAAVIAIVGVGGPTAATWLARRTPPPAPEDDPAGKDP